MVTPMTSFDLTPVTQSDSTVIDPPYKGLYITVEGTIKARNSRGTTVTIVLPAVAAGGSYPCTIPGRWDMVFATDTSIADASIFGII